ncbi:MAG: hypothetical protein NWF14_08060 [Candidatus Bathyarchaeota archaeon]|nr:hypothetical protein [Candidatus Bathyarchaeota archaeon]
MFKMPVKFKRERTSLFTFGDLSQAPEEHCFGAVCATYIYVREDHRNLQ